LGATSEGNTLIGPFGDAGGTNTLDCALGQFGGTVGGVSRGNRIYAAGSSFGVAIQGEAIRDSVTLAANSGAVIEGNLIDGANVGLFLQQGTAKFFGARISRNDIVESVTRPVSGSGMYAIDSELSVNDQGHMCVAGSTGCQGNYWGHNAPPCFRATDTNTTFIHDSNPFCHPVSGL
jgi:hypothetical protein